MSNNEKKPQPIGQGQPAPSSPSPSTAPPATQIPPRPTPLTPAPAPRALASSPASSPAKGPLISRRAFMVGAVLASAGLAAGSIAAGGGIPGILSPLVPPAKGETRIATASEMDTILAAGNDVVQGPLGPMPFKFFYWPYDPSVSPYYRNVLVRVPDQLASQTWDGQNYLAYNTTCVHLQCLVNPGYADNQYRLQCPCHGSQYEITDAVPQRGPAFDLNLGRLARIKLRVDSNGDIFAEDWDSSHTLEGTPGLGIH